MNQVQGPSLTETSAWPPSSPAAQVEQAATTACSTRGRSFHVSARAITLDVAKAMEGLEAQRSPKARELKEQVTQ